MYDRDSDLPVWRLEHFPRYPGLVVCVQPPSFGALDVFAQAIPALARAATPAAAHQPLVRVAQALGDALVSWTVTKSGRRVPATRAGVLQLDQAFVLDLVQTWLTIAKNPPVAEPTTPAADLDEHDDAELRELQMGIPMQVLPPAEPALAAAG